MLTSSYFHKQPLKKTDYQSNQKNIIGGTLTKKNKISKNFNLFSEEILNRLSHVVMIGGSGGLSDRVHSPHRVADIDRFDAESC